MAVFNRREFLKKTSAGAAAIAAVAAYPGAAFSQVIGTSAPFPDYKALVCVFLYGGNDSFNMLVPRSAAEYNVYRASRQNMAIAQAIKDATMSHFILKNTSEKNIFLHFNGAYHSDNYQGILVYLLKSMDKEKVMTISTVSQKDISSLEKDNEGIADYIICVPDNMTTTY